MPDSVGGHWETLQDGLHNADQNWQVWLEGYEARLRGGPTWPELTPEQNEELEVVIATLPEEVWRQGPAEVNAEIKGLIPRPDPTPGGEAISLLGSELGSSGLRPSTALEELFRQAALLGPGRREDNKKLTTSLLVFAAVRLGSAARSDEDWEFLAAFAAALREMAGSRFEELTAEYFRPEPLLPAAGETLVRELSANTRSTLKRAPGFRAPSAPEGILGVESCLLALLQPSDANALRNLDRMGVDVAALHDRLSSSDVLDRVWTQGLVEPSRPAERHEAQFAADRAETTRDLLGRAPLAFALAAQINRIWDSQIRDEAEPTEWQRRWDNLHILRLSRSGGQADDAAFILHIDAPWGGGKTTFASFIARILNPHAFQLGKGAAGAMLLSKLPMTDDKLWPQAYRERRWHIVAFNAWQHVHVSPPWWNFYENFRRQCLRGFLKRTTSRRDHSADGRFGSVITAADASLRRYGRVFFLRGNELLWRIWSPGDSTGSRHNAPLGRGRFPDLLDWPLRLAGDS